MSDSELPLVIVSHKLPDLWLRKLDGRCRILIGPDTSVTSGLAQELLSNLERIEGLFALLTVPVTGTLLDQAPRLQVVSNMAVGVDNIDLAACTQRGIPVGHTPGVLTEGTADLAMTLLLAVARRLPEAWSDAREGRWTHWNPSGWLGADLSGATLGIVGLGKIGSAVARRARGFGLKIAYASQNPKPDLEEKLEARRLPLEALLSQSDFVSLHVPLAADTRGMIDEDALQLMKPSSILINVARGPIVDSTALYRALKEGWIAAAGLDVTDPEPLPAEAPLYTLPNCLIVPHIGSATANTRRRMAELACDNLLAGLTGKSLPYLANPAVKVRE